MIENNNNKADFHEALYANIAKLCSQKEAMMKSRKTESHTPTEAGVWPYKVNISHPNMRNHAATNLNPWACQDPMKPCTPLCMNAPTNEGQCTPEATGEMREPHTCCGGPRRPTPMHKPHNHKPKPCV
ncbi:hypothetical protein BS47DRAFT_1358269 [Hydnum rufescens UP504]|uniref:Uncharacterized protein n=1 Tax=Hydnum rufescens UP504 TaxID=1448309 RepID=A0A9P6E1F8_9AGAM|nr:hypothetical protein BS47DRAFT_1358269 [Hydnum rufescens UP504]